MSPRYDSLPPVLIAIAAILLLAPSRAQAQTAPTPAGGAAATSPGAQSVPSTQISPIPPASTTPATTNPLTPSPGSTTASPTPTPQPSNNTPSQPPARPLTTPQTTQPTTLTSPQTTTPAPQQPQPAPALGAPANTPSIAPATPPSGPQPQQSAPATTPPLIFGAPITPAQSTTSAPTGASISLNDAITRAMANEPTFVNAKAEAQVLALDRRLAKKALLPQATYHNQAIYTQPGGSTNQGTLGNPRFVANNAVHEYISQAVVTETIGLNQFAAIATATAAAAKAAAELEVARRGLVSAVVALYYGSLASQRKIIVFRRAYAEAAAFTDLTQKRESAREAAHADVVKALLQQQQRQRDLADAQLAVDKARLELGVLLFPDPTQPYALPSPENPAPLPTFPEIQTLANRQNPELASATAALNATNAAIFAARAEYLPGIGLNYTYGIDAPHFAITNPDGSRNLGYSISATVDIPIWNWFATQDRVKQAELRRGAARVALTAAQRRLIIQLQEYYAEAASVRDQLLSLDDSVRTAQESLRLTMLRYSSGEATVLEVVDAQNSLTTAEIAREDGAVRYQAALANLQTLTGTL